MTGEGIISIARWLFGQPYLLLCLTSLFWAGNFVLGRAVSGEVPPIALAFWRWAGAALIVLPFAWPVLRRDLAAIRRAWRLVLLLTVVGVAVFNTFVYIGLQDTTAINALLMMSAMPLAILVWSFAIFRERVGPLQAFGVVLSLGGVLAIIARGDIATLLAVDLRAGDLWVFAAVVSYALYSACLRRKPAISPASFLFVTFLGGALVLLPFHAWEWVTVARPHLDLTTLGAMAYVALFPSVLAYLCFNRGVELIGANRAGPFVHLMPLFGSLLAIVFLGERLATYHVAGIALIGCGLLLGTRKARRPPQPTAPAPAATAKSDLKGPIP